METGGSAESSQNKVIRVSPVDQPRPSNFLSFPQKRPNPIPPNHNNGVTYKRPVPSLENLPRGNVPVHPNAVAGVSQNNKPISPNVGCLQCGNIVMKGPMPNQHKKYCSLDCAKSAVSKNNDIGGQPNFLKFHVQHQLKQQEIARIGREILKVKEEWEGESSRSSAADDFYRGSSSASNSVHELEIPPRKKKKKDENASFDWIDMLKNPDFKAASVSLVKHAPLARMWDNVTVGMKLEVENTDVDDILMEKAFWVASVVRIQGYYVLLRYEGFGNDTSGDFWINLCSKSVHHVGWCANKGRPLIPPKSISRKFTDWRNFLVNRLTGARTLPLNFLSKIEHGIRSQHQLGESLEVVDKNQISQLRVAFIKQIVGRRLHVEYFDSVEDGGFWCHEESRLIHPAGWAKTIGHRILHPANYNPPALASTPYDAEYESMELEVGMKLEAIDPLNLSAICAATIKQVLARGYVMVRVDCYEEDSGGSDWFCYHISSPYVYHCGYCASNKVTLTPPTGYDKATFTWSNYFEETNTKPAPVKIKKPLNHKFVVGMKVEVADLMDPRLICVATIAHVVGRLVKIHFDGWEEEYDQWMDARSPDIYPIGWCEIVNHRLEPPRPPVPIPKPPPQKKAKKGKKKATVRGKGTIKTKMAKSVKASKPLSTEPSDSPPEVKQVPTGIVKNVPAATPSVKRLSTEGSAPRIIPQNIVTTENQGQQNVKVRTVVNNNETKSNDKRQVAEVRSYASNGNSEKLERPVHSTVNTAHQASTSRPESVNIPNSFDNPEGEKPVEPLTWSVTNVEEFLKSHDCGSYCELFQRNEIDGKKFLDLTKDEIVSLTGKVGPAVKIFELVSQLKRFSSAVNARKTAFRKPNPFS